MTRNHICTHRAPVAIEAGHKSSGTKIAMTAPVAIEGQGTAVHDDTAKKMQFWLPDEYDDLSKIPKPTSPYVKVLEVPPAFGAVHRYNGSFNDERSREKVIELLHQLKEDGLKLDEDEAMRCYQSWGYNPPFTVPYLRRNEVWIPLTEKQVKEMTQVLSESNVK